MAKVLGLGYSMEDVDAENRLRFMGATGATAETLGAIRIERRLEKDSSSGKHLDFQVWEDKVGLAEVVLGADEDSGSHGDCPGVLPIILLDRLGKKAEADRLASREAWRTQNQGGESNTNSPSNPPAQNQTEVSPSGILGQSTSTPDMSPVFEKSESPPAGQSGRHQPKGSSPTDREKEVISARSLWCPCCTVM
ncbi:hypothetical protein B0H67DRAFT_591384 [Lasiosphaeris hirsuta]|uniref:Uncharacterized protein n=1 Tax=Lasiosphaeris hirsuta TaxID=260670 RepID=A0AA40DKA4_9PEZI|nr:hypothetical protein B0H67DRAFT_591384 [Lasiosphaeris hirsuta]